MRALVIYESMYGNTRVVASNIADGLRGTYEVTLVPVAAATADLIGLAAAFDTRLAGAPVLTGRASRGISRLLRRHGYRLITPPESFVVTKLNTLIDGEPSRARAWGEALAAAAGLAVPAA